MENWKIWGQNLSRDQYDMAEAVRICDSVGVGAVYQRSNGK